MNYTTNDYLEQLEQDREDLVDNLETKGITGLTGNETFTELVYDILNIGNNNPIAWINNYNNSINTTADYLEQLEQDRQNMISNLETKGITGLTGNETFTELVPEVLNIITTPYIKLNYIEGNGTQYIDTGVAPYQTTFECQFQLTTLDDVSGVKTPFYVGGTWNSNNNRYYPCTYDPDGTQLVCTNRSNTRTILQKPMDLNVHTVKYNDINNYVFYDDVNKGTVSDLTTQTDRNIYIFALNSSRGVEQYLYGKIYYLKIWDKLTNTLVRDFIPVKRISDNEICMYDKVSEQFFTNQGTGTFIAGSVVN